MGQLFYLFPKDWKIKEDEDKIILANLSDVIKDFAKTFGYTDKELIEVIKRGRK